MHVSTKRMPFYDIYGSANWFEGKSYCTTYVQRVGMRGQVMSIISRYFEGKKKNCTRMRIKIKQSFTRTTSSVRTMLRYLRKSSISHFPRGRNALFTLHVEPHSGLLTPLG